MSAPRGMPMLALLTLLAACDQPSDATFQGYFEAEYILVAAPSAGRLERLAVEAGAVVAPGDPLFALEATAEDAAMARAEAELDRAQAQLADLQTGDRPEELAVLTAQLAEAQAALRYSEAELARQERLVTNLASGQTTIRRYRFPKVKFKDGATVRSGIKEIYGTRILNDEVPIQ